MTAPPPNLTDRGYSRNRPVIPAKAGIRAAAQLAFPMREIATLTVLPPWIPAFAPRQRPTRRARRDLPQVMPVLRSGAKRMDRH